MKSRFEKHDNQLFRMLEKSEPLMPDSKFPCLVRLIQDGQMGRFNNSINRFDVLGNMPFIVQEIKEGSDYFSSLHAYGSKDFLIANIYQLEVIGYPVADGSKDWALYQMMQGEKICHNKAPSIVYCKHAGDIRRQVRYNCVDYMSASAWLNGADKNGWLKAQELEEIE